MKRKEPPSRRKKTQHDKFVELAREVGADENESEFVDKLRRVAKAPQKRNLAESRLSRFGFFLKSQPI